MGGGGVACRLFSSVNEVCTLLSLKSTSQLKWKIKIKSESDNKQKVCKWLKASGLFPPFFPCEELVTTGSTSQIWKSDSSVRSALVGELRRRFHRLPGCCHRIAIKMSLRGKKRSIQVNWLTIDCISFHSFHPKFIDAKAFFLHFRTTIFFFLTFILDPVAASFTPAA